MGHEGGASVASGQPTSDLEMQGKSGKSVRQVGQVSRQRAKSSCKASGQVGRTSRVTIGDHHLAITLDAEHTNNRSQKTYSQERMHDYIR